jgi:DNA-binding transcriptional LysR family regulator
MTQPHLPLRRIGGPLLPAAVEICLAWHPRYEFDAAHRWFRDELGNALKKKK